MEVALVAEDWEKKFKELVARSEVLFTHIETDSRARISCDVMNIKRAFSDYFLTESQKQEAWKETREKTLKRGLP